MPVATGVEDRRAYLRDSELELSAPSGASATANGTSKAFDGSAVDVAKLVVNSAGYTSYSAGTAEWIVSLKASDDNSTFVEINSITFPATASVTEIAFSGAEVTEKVGGRATHIKADLSKTGSPGNATGSIYLYL
tara:strand:+ start:135 stop:539 length:405 start_codon:yes stop_codon:yes gene_type:complete